MFDRRNFLVAAGAAAFLPRSIFAVEPAAGDGVNKFAASLYGELRKSAGNVFLSPYSISTALAMTAAGAKGNTLAQMQKVLCLPADAAASDAAYEKMAKGLDGTGKGFELAVANALWAQAGYPWANDYIKRVTDVFHASIHDANFAANAEASRKTINDWVEKQTKEKIKELFAPGTIDSTARLLLTNAIYFKGDWLTAFDNKLTKDGPFTKLDGTKKDVPLMYRNGKIDWFENDDVTAIRLPYKVNEISFLAVLPKKADQFAAIDANLNAETLAAWTKDLKPANDVRLTLPRFKVEMTYGLNAPLIALGMSDAFNSAIADFSGMVTSGPSLVISSVIHKAFVEVSEEGTVAAAATGAAFRFFSAPLPQESKIFRADRPFLFALRHEQTGTLLFLGRYTTP